VGNNGSNYHPVGTKEWFAAVGYDLIPLGYDLIPLGYELIPLGYELNPKEFELDTLIFG